MKGKYYKMANTTTKTTKVDNSAEKENKELKSQIAEMQKQMKNLMEQMSQNKPEKVKEVEQFNYEYDVPVMNCASGELNISTDGYGQGTIYQFLEIGEIQDIPYGDLKKIISKNRRFAENGVFYILDEKIVQKERLKNKYTKVFTLKEIQDAFEHKNKSIIEIYKLANDIQKKLIIDMIVDKKFNEEKLDANILLEIGNLCGRDLINLIDPMKIPVDGEK